MRAYLAYRLGQTAYLAERLLEAGMPIIEPAGGHAIYLDAGRLLPHIPHAEFPGQALAGALYLEGGVRGVEIGSVMFAHPTPIPARSSIPSWSWCAWPSRAGCTPRAHIDYVADVLAELAKTASSLRGYRITYAPPLLRHFTAQFEPLNG